MNQISLNEIQKLSKVEVHGHIDGYLQPSDIIQIARAHKKQLMTPDGQALATKDQFLNFWAGGSYGKPLQQIVSRFHPVTSLMQTEETISEVAATYVKCLAKEKIIYAEGRFAPQYHTKEGLTMSGAVHSMLEGLRDGAEKYGVQTKLIICIGREASSTIGKDVAQVALDFAGQGVVAVDLACNETDFPPEKHVPAYEATFDSSLRRTVHAGEGGRTVAENLRNIRTSIELLRADGLGHAINLPLDKGLMEEVLKRGIRVESNPVANLTLGLISNIEELHIEKLLRMGVLVSINSDDPAMWPHGSLSENMFAVARAYGFEMADMNKLILNGVKGAFISATEKEELAEKITEENPLGA